MNFDLSTLPRRDVLAIDIKSFFASVECVKRGLDPLKAHLVVISKKQKGGIVLAASPAAKKDFGIKATKDRAFNIPNDERIIWAEPRMNLYLKMNRMIQEIYKRYVSTEDLHVYSIDESFLDVTAYTKIHGNKFSIARQIQDDIMNELALFATVGLGDNPLLAKLAMDLSAKKCKDGIAYWRYEDVPNTLWKIEKLSDMWGIGSRTEKTLNRMGIFTVYDLAHFDVNVLRENLGVLGEQLYYHSWGVDFSRLSEKVAPRERSYGKSQILLRDYKGMEIETVINEMVEDVAARLRKYKVVGEIVHLSIVFSKQESEKGFSHQLKLDSPTDSTKRLREICLFLFRKHYKGEVVRQIAISVGKIYSKTDMQLNLFSDTDQIKKDEALDSTIDGIRSKFGKTAILRATSFTSAGTAIKRARLVGGHEG